MKEIKGNCPFRVLKDTNQKFNNVVFPEESIPTEGMCQTTGKACEFPFMDSNCRNADTSLIEEAQILSTS
jgi:hypothetical protein